MRRVLIIEDDEEQATLGLRLLRTQGIACKLAGTFEEGLINDRNTDFDCVVVDASLPDLSTPYDTVSRLRDFRAPVVVWTAHTDPALVRAVRETGAAFVSKPGGDLLIEKVWSQINWHAAALDSETGQLDAQKRMQESELKETTPVTLGLGRVLAIVAAIIAGTVSITAVVLTKVGNVDTNLTAVRSDLATYSVVANKRQDTFEAALKEMSEAQQKRLREWTKWRYGVSHDIKHIGESVKVPTETNPDLDP